MADAIVSIVDDDADVRDSLQALLESASLTVWSFASAREVLDHPSLSQSGCLIVDIRMPDMDGLTLQEELIKRRVGIPVIVVTGDADVPLAVRAMKAGAVDFLEKPFADDLLVESVKRALELGEEVRGQDSMTQTAKDRIDLLTERERQVLAHLIDGQPNKIIAYELDISPRTVEVYRARVMGKLHAQSLAEVVRTAIVAGFSPRTREKITKISSQRR
jgi:two-component system response regulator FixJ